MTSANSHESALAAIKAWHNDLRNYPGGKARGSITAALVTVEHLRENYILSIDNHIAEGRAQVRGLSPGSVAKILARYGETRKYLVEGGRTNRGSRRAVEDLLESLKPLALENLPHMERNEVLNAVQMFLVERVVEYFNSRRLAPPYDPAASTWHSINQILHEAKESGKSGPVAQHLVGAKLQLRFPKLNIPNNPASAADQQTGRDGDFQIRDTAFHVTVAPSRDNLFDRVKENIQHGLRVYVIVPDDKVALARGYAEEQLLSQSFQIAVCAIEDFVAQNIDELSLFAKGQLLTGFKALLHEFNRRVDEVETDKSVLIEIPATLQ